MRIALLSYFGFPDLKYRVRLIYTLEQAKALKNQGVDIEVFDLNSSHELFKDIQIENFEGIKVHRMPACSLKNIFSIRKKKKYLKERLKDFNAILLNFALPEYFIYWKEIKKRKVPVAIIAHGGDVMGEWMNPYLKLLKRILLRSVNFIFPVSEYTENLVSALMKRSRKDKTKVVLNYNGINTEKFQIVKNLSKEKCRKDMGFDKKQFIILSICDLVWRKGLDLLINALGNFKKENNNFKYIIIGRGPEKSNLMKQVEYLNLKDNVNFIDYIESDTELTKYIKAADVYSMISRNVYENLETEGFGISYIEASYLGVPIIAGNNGGSISAVKHQFTGYLVNPYSDLCEENILNYLKLLYTNKNEYQRLSENGPLLVERDFLWSQNAKRILYSISQV